MWSDIIYVEVSYECGYKNQIEIIYNVHLNDGVMVNLCNSENFYNNIIEVDNFMKDKKIKIIRRTIKPSDYDDLTKSYDSPYINQVMLEILNLYE